MRVDELQAILATMDSKAPVEVWHDGTLYPLQEARQIDSEQARTERKHKHTVTLA